MVEEGKPISDENDAFFEFGKKALTESIDIIKDFIKLMIPITTGIIPTYFALLKFIGIESATKTTNTGHFLLGPIIMLFSLISFIATSFPVPMKMTVSNIESIKHYRTVSIRWKYGGACIGSALFLYGLLVMMLNLQL